MRTLPAIKHGEKDICVALGLGDANTAVSTFASYMAFCESKYGALSKSQIIENLSRVAETDEVMRRVICLFALAMMDQELAAPIHEVCAEVVERTKKDIAEVKKEKAVVDETPLHYALRVQYSLRPEEVRRAVHEMKMLVKRGIDPKEVLAQIGLGPNFASCLE